MAVGGGDDGGGRGHLIRKTRDGPGDVVGVEEAHEVLPDTRVLVAARRVEKRRHLHSLQQERPMGQGAEQRALQTARRHSRCTWRLA